MDRRNKRHQHSAHQSLFTHRRHDSRNCRLFLKQIHIKFKYGRLKNLEIQPYKATIIIKYIVKHPKEYRGGLHRNKSET